MIKKTITYVDYNGEERTDDFWFNLSEAELAEMEVSVHGGYLEMIMRIVKAKDIPEIAKVFKQLLIRSYGERSADGASFYKIDASGNPLWRNLVSSAAYSKLYLELSSDEDKAAEFVNGVMPPVDEDKRREAQKQIESELSGNTVVPIDVAKD